jgi:branched-chain amino acid transport system substrate-binding protein
MQESIRRRRPFVRSTAAFVAAGTLVALAVTVSGASVRPHFYPSYPTTLSASDISMAAKYTGGSANKVAKLPTIYVGYINDSTGAVAYPENVEGADVALSFINGKLDGIKGHKLGIKLCDSQNSNSAATACAVTMIHDHVKLVVTGTLNSSNDAPMYKDLAKAGIPVIQGNDLTTADFEATTAQTYMPGAPGVVKGMAKFIGKDGLHSATKTITGFYDQGDTGSATALALLFANQPELKSGHYTLKQVAIDSPWSVSQVETALESATPGSIFVPLIPINTCIAFAQGMSALSLHNTVVTSGLCFGKAMVTALGSYPSGWYFGDYGVNYFMYDNHLTTSEQLGVYIAAFDAYDSTVPPAFRQGDYTGFAGPSFGTMLTVAKLYNKLGVAATAAKLGAAAHSFAGPQWGISGALTCGKGHSIFTAICGSYIGIAEYTTPGWVPIADAYNNKLIDPFV